MQRRIGIGAVGDREAVGAVRGQVSSGGLKTIVDHHADGSGNAGIKAVDLLVHKGGSRGSGIIDPYQLNAVQIRQTLLPVVCVLAPHNAVINGVAIHYKGAGTDHVNGAPVGVMLIKCLLGIHQNIAHIIRPGNRPVGIGDLDRVGIYRFNALGVAEIGSLAILQCGIQVPFKHLSRQLGAIVELDALAQLNGHG